MASKKSKIASSSSSSSNWAELPPELISSILIRLSTVDLLKAQIVCRSWRRVSKDPSMWRIIELEDVASEDMCRRAIDLSDGGLVEIFIDVKNLGEAILAYMAERSSLLRSLILSSRSCFSFFPDDIFREAVVKLPLLEYLHVPSFIFSRESLRVVGKSCPNLKTLKLHHHCPSSRDADDSIAMIIADSMPGLRHLELCGHPLSNMGLKAILDGCPHLECLDLRECFHIDLSGNLGKRCLERIKYLRRPNDYPPETEEESYLNDILSDIGLPDPPYD
ncbi:PREDICTED: putative F-box/LRR-repeat protein 23 [Camelina sativa]|uniref:F-box/LRR-repeat protein 23 n=1 Tax=Camelina sativa TaxID=90675 RepID=A0ABM0SXP0_CAMSA|nr:PREDICTED: putative F-box/LRR-repeat protein 23 [Camelina sativa]